MTPWTISFLKHYHVISSSNPLKRYLQFYMAITTHLTNGVSIRGFNVETFQNDFLRLTSPFIPEIISSNFLKSCPFLACVKWNCHNYFLPFTLGCLVFYGLWRAGTIGNDVTLGKWLVCVFCGSPLARSESCFSCLQLGPPRAARWQGKDRFLVCNESCASSIHRQSL